MLEERAFGAVQDDYKGVSVDGELVERVDPIDRAVEQVVEYLETSRRERIRNDVFDSPASGSVASKLYWGLLVAAVCVTLGGMASFAMSGRWEALPQTLFRTGIVSLLLLGVARVCHPIVRCFWLARGERTPLYDSLAARVSVSSRVIGQLSTLPSDALETHRRALALESKRLRGRRAMLLGFGVSAGTLTLEFLRTIAAMSPERAELASVIERLGRALPPSWSVVFGLTGLVLVLVSAALHIEQFDVHASLIDAAAAIQKMRQPPGGQVAAHAPRSDGSADRTDTNNHASD